MIFGGKFILCFRFFSFSFGVWLTWIYEEIIFCLECLLTYSRFDFLLTMNFIITIGDFTSWFLIWCSVCFSQKMDISSFFKIIFVGKFNCFFFLCCFLNHKLIFMVFFCLLVQLFLFLTRCLISVVVCLKKKFTFLS